MNENYVFVTGANGMLGRAVVKVLENTDYYTPFPIIRSGMELTDFDYGVFIGGKIINCAGIVRGRYDVNQREMGLVNGLVPHRLAKIAERLIQVSTDCVFDGTKGPYGEWDNPTPIDNYGMSKLIGEIWYGNHLTVRTSFVGFGQRGLLRWLLDQPEGATVPGFRRWLWNGLYVETLARQLVRLLDEPITGILHIEGPEISKYELLDMLAKAVRPDLFVNPSCSDDKNMMLKSERMDWSIWNFGWIDVIKDLKADYEAQS